MRSVEFAFYGPRLIVNVKLAAVDVAADQHGGVNEAKVCAEIEPPDIVWRIEVLHRPIMEDASFRVAPVFAEPDMSVLVRIAALVPFHLLTENVGKWFPHFRPCR